MMRFILAVIFTIFSCSNLAQASEVFDLRGFWYRTNAQYGEMPLEFIKVGKLYRSHSQERIINEWGRLSHTIDQSVRVAQLDESNFSGKVDFYDSRGCTFKDLEVLIEVQDQDTISALMTVPRYKFVTFSTPGNRFERPGVLETECQLLEYVQVPVSLRRH